MVRSWLLLVLLLDLHLLLFSRYDSVGASSDPIGGEIHGDDGDVGGGRRVVMDVEGGPRSVVWIVQLSDLHFSVHRPNRALDFRRLIPPTLSMVNPSLVLITGDLTDGKSKDLLTMKQNVEEWIEYQSVMADVIRESGLDQKIFYDLKGNHDHFGVPMTGGTYDFYRKYSHNARVGRSGNVFSVTLKSQQWKHLFVGFDSVMEVGLRGPTNVFGHPTEQILDSLDIELSQWNLNNSELPVTKISFGHFPTSFSALSEKGRSLKDIFLKHSISSYLCGHLHSGLGKNLKRHHYGVSHFPFAGNFYQLNVHTEPDRFDKKECYRGSESTKEFWEWEMGDWRKRRALRILAIDSGHVSFLDTDLSLGIRKTIILPTFPLDSRFMQRVSSYHDYECRSLNTTSYETIRALVFSDVDLYIVNAKVYDSRPGHLSLVMEVAMKKHTDVKSRGDLYEALWNWRAFVDPSPDRYWLQIEAVDIMGDSTFSQLRPFSVNGHFAKVTWTWKEFKVMGIQLSSVFYPILYASLLALFSILLVPRVLIHFKMGTTYFSSPRSRGRGILFVSISWFPRMLLEFSKLTTAWSAVLLYSLFLTYLPWFSGNVFTKVGQVGYMTLSGWSISTESHLGVPDIMIVVLSHIFYVVFPAIFVMSALSAELAGHRMYCKKQDDAKEHGERQENQISFRMLHASATRNRWMRKILLLTSLLILWQHWKQCRALVKAYEMNPLFHAPIYCFMLPFLLIYTIYLTGGSRRS